MHISTQDQLPLLAPLSATIQAPPAALVPTPSPLTAVDWSVLINKVQAGELLAITIMPHPDASSANSEEAGVTPISKIFTAESALFPLEPKPGALPDCLVQMTLNWVFIPLSMLTTDSLNIIETNQGSVSASIQTTTETIGCGQKSGNLYLGKTNSFLFIRKQNSYSEAIPVSEIKRLQFRVANITQVLP